MPCRTACQRMPCRCGPCSLLHGVHARWRHRVLALGGVHTRCMEPSRCLHALAPGAWSQAAVSMHWRQVHAAKPLPPCTGARCKQPSRCLHALAPSAWSQALTPKRLRLAPPCTGAKRSPRQVVHRVCISNPIRCHAPHIASSATGVIQFMSRK
jgi:hypothetical protein